MSKNACRMTGLILMMLSVFMLIGGLFLKGGEIPAFLAPSSLAAGIILLALGIVFYRILKSE